MLNFEKLKLCHIPIVRKYLKITDGRSCDNTIGATFVWREYFDIFFAEWNDTLVMRFKLKGEEAEQISDGRAVYSVPIGKAPEAALRELYRTSLELDERLAFYLHDDSSRELLESAFELKLYPLRDSFDYVYDVAALSSVSGKKLAGQRNHINYFERTYPNWHYEKLTEENIPVALEILDNFMRLRGKDSKAVLGEDAKIVELLQNYSEYKLFGGVLYSDENAAVAFSIGDRKGDTLFVHIEKADTRVRGAYPMVVREFARRYADEATLYVNREDDAGDLGLRTAKLAWHPSFFCEKYYAEVIGIK